MAEIHFEVGHYRLLLHLFKFMIHVMHPIMQRYITEGVEIASLDVGVSGGIAPCILNPDTRWW